MSYKLASEYIPARNILKNVLQITHQYITTGNLDNTSLHANYGDLVIGFPELCSSSIELISKLIINPKNTDFRNFCDKLGHKINNIEHFINLNLENELQK